MEKQMPRAEAPQAWPRGQPRGHAKRSLRALGSPPPGEHPVLRAPAHGEGQILHPDSARAQRLERLMNDTAHALEQTAPALAGREPGGRRSSLATIPGIAVAFLPKVTCPACWPAYASVFSSLGLGFLLDARWLIPATAIFLFIAVASLGFRARRRRGYGPFLVGLGAAAVVLGGKFGLGIGSAMYAGIPLLVGASLWNSWPKRSPPACPTCAPT